MIVLLALLAAAVLPVAANAAPVYSKPALCQILEPCEPPARYASGPYLAPVIIREVALHEIQAICRGGYGAHAGPGVMGCAEFTGDRCVVRLPSDIKKSVPELYEVVRRHELGHCRGWVHAVVVN